MRERRRMMMPPYSSKVEYLKSTDRNNFCVNTEVARPDTFQSSRMEVKARFTDLSGRQIQGTENGFYFGVNNNRWEGGFNTYATGADTNIHTFVFENTTSQKKLYVDGVLKITKSYEYKTTEFANPLCVFNILTAINDVGWLAEIYEETIYLNGTKVRDMIPIRIGTVGYLYDKVSGKMFGNSRSGKFVLGSDIK